MHISKLIHAVLNYLNRRFVEGDQSNNSIYTGAHIGMKKTSVKNLISIQQNNTGKHKTAHTPIKSLSGWIHAVSKGPDSSPLNYKFGSTYPC